MSKILDEMEAMSYVDGIKDMETIDDTIEKLLSMTYAELAGDNPSHRLLCRDLSNGFELNPAALEEKTIREILMFIGYEPGVFFYQLSMDEDWFYGNEKFARNKRLLCSFSCYLLAQTMVNRKNELFLLNRLFHIDYQSFIKYLDNRIASSCNGGKTTVREMADRRVKLNRIATTTGNFIIDFHREHIIENHTIEDLLVTATSVCNKKWNCGFTKLNDYVRDVMEAHQVLKMFFMDSIRTNMVFSSRNEFLMLWDECKSEYFDKHKSDFREIDYRFCYE